ncbi:metallophosphoesterase (plasmid) [Arthrobacter sp. FW305-BF8]|uniref:metallophosphoesterase n=1 Tax=Arthrobacter sp. FW305-BF8 TaxID=2879617 RepID=UPI001F2F004E|nr:metallophosphoesterase [Arthrobacter sp. FW305-BF8]UKA56624.1 metallophosphoesterase [Arthrobacter sp. FW305-BF8]
MGARKPGRAGVFSVLAGLCLLLAGCIPVPQPVPPAPSPPATTSDPAATSVRFTAQGDIGVSDGARNVLDLIAGLKPQLNLALGDFAYEPGIEDQFCDMVKGTLGADFPYQLITGNHESDGSDGDIDKFAACLPNRLPGLQGEYGTQWYADVPQDNPIVRFVMISPGIEFKDGQTLDYSQGSDRWQWTTAAIDGAEAAGIPWTVVGMHVPCRSMGKYACQPGQELTNMLVEKKVDLVLAGHEHAYQRTHQIGTGDGCPRLVPNEHSARCLADTDASMVRGNGTVFATSGAGGVGMYDITADDPEAGYFAAVSGKNRDPAKGTLEATATPKRLSVRFVPAQGTASPMPSPPKQSDRRPIAATRPLPVPNGRIFNAPVT